MRSKDEIFNNIKELIPAMAEQYHSRYKPKTTGEVYDIERSIILSTMSQILLVMVEVLTDIRDKENN